jgi:hypothetical protein
VGRALSAYSADSSIYLCGPVPLCFEAAFGYFIQGPCGVPISQPGQAVGFSKKRIGYLGIDAPTETQKNDEKD